MTWIKEWQSCQRILCVRPDNIGDVIMMTPVFRALKESFPGVKLSLLTSSVGKRITPFIPDLDETLVYDAPWIENEQLQPKRDAISQVVSMLQQKAFDGAILLTNFSQNPLPLALIMYLTGIPQVLGYCRELPQDLISHWIPDHEPFSFPIHGVQRQLQLITTIGAKTISDRLSLKIPSATYSRLQSRLVQKSIDLSEPYFVLHPGASLKRRQYPEKHFITAAKKLQATFGYPILLTGTGKEKAVTLAMQQQIGENAYSLADELTLAEFIALIHHAKVIISNNTAPIHIAAAVGTPVVDLYARSNPEHTPWKVRHRVLYFDIPHQLRTKNTLLLSLIPPYNSPMPVPDDIVQTVQEVVEEKETSSLDPSFTTWWGATTQKMNTTIKESSIYPIF